MSGHARFESDCCFCQEFGGEPHGTPIPSGRVIAESEYGVAVPSLGALREGHLLLIPKSHWKAFSSLPEKELFDLLELRRCVLQDLRGKYGTLVQFEHGVGSTGGGCGIDHAHLHMVPWTSDKPLARSLPTWFKPRPVSSISEIRTMIEGGESYLYLEEDGGGAMIFSADTLPSQFMRRLLADSIGLSEWDWRLHPYNAPFLSTLDALKPDLRHRT